MGMNECLWCNGILTKNKIEHRGNFFCNRNCYLTASRVIRMGLGKRNSGGKSGIQTMLLGLLLKTLKQYPHGLVLKDLVSFTHKEYSDYSKLLNAAKLHHYFRIYVKPDVYTKYKDRSSNVYVYKIVNVVCLKDWLRPQYIEYLETFLSKKI